MPTFTTVWNGVGGTDVFIDVVDLMQSFAGSDMIAGTAIAILAIILFNSVVRVVKAMLPVTKAPFNETVAPGAREADGAGTDAVDHVWDGYGESALDTYDDPAEGKHRQEHGDLAALVDGYGSYTRY